MLRPDGSLTWPEHWEVADIDDPSDPRLHPFRDLTDMDLRLRVEPEGGFFMAEGRLVIERVARSGYSIDAVLTAPKWLPVLAEILPRYAGPVLVAPRDVVDTIAGYPVHRGALAVVRRPDPLSVPDLAQGPGNVLILEDLVDPTNVGLVFRSAAALGIGGVVVSPRCVDPLYRRAVKTSMGSVLDLPWARSRDWEADLAGLRECGLSVVALTPDPGAEPIEVALSARTRARVALMVGTEGAGLSDLALRASERRARIPMSAGIDSLNVAAAVAVACYALSR